MSATHIYVQWTTDPARGWERYESVDELAVVSAKHIPRDDHLQGRMTEDINDQPGWVHAVCYQGITFDEYDHYCVEEAKDNGVRVTVWKDDPLDWGDGKMAIQIDFFPPAIDSNGVLNTVQHRRHWSTPNFSEQWTKGGKVQFDFPWYGWDAFVPPDGKVFHGIWTEQILHLELRRLQSRHSWHEWIG
jgi:hypothetical protein